MFCPELLPVLCSHQPSAGLPVQLALLHRADSAAYRDFRHHGPALQALLSGGAGSQEQNLFCEYRPI